MIVPSGMKPVPFEINLTCQKPTIGAPTGATCGIAVACALAVAVVAFTGAECMSRAVAVMEDLPSCGKGLVKAQDTENTAVALNEPGWMLYCPEIRSLRSHPPCAQHF